MKKFIAACLLVGSLSSTDVLLNKVNASNESYVENSIVVENRTLLPLRAVSEELDAKVTWDNKTKTILVSKGQKNILLTIGSKVARINDKVHNLDVPANIYSDVTMVPIRFVTEQLGATVTWDAKQMRATILSEGKTIIAYAKQYREPTWVHEFINKGKGTTYLNATSPNEYYSLAVNKVSNQLTIGFFTPFTGSDLVSGYVKEISKTKATFIYQEAFVENPRTQYGTIKKIGNKMTVTFKEYDGTTTTLTFN